MRFTKETAVEAGRKGGMRTKDPAQRRDNYLRIRVTREELNMIDTKASDKEMTRTKLIINAVRKYK